MAVILEHILQYNFFGIEKNYYISPRMHFTAVPTSGRENNLYTAYILQFNISFDIEENIWCSVTLMQVLKFLSFSSWLNACFSFFYRLVKQAK